MRKALQVSLVALAFALAAHAAEAASLPVLSRVTSGAVTIAPPPNGSTTMIISQSTPVAAIDWKSFSIGSGYSVGVLQPDVSSLLINRVTGSAISQIDGRLDAKGQVFLVNPNGITIGQTGKVTAGGFLASTLDLTGKDGAYTLSARPELFAARVTVAGKISGGFVVLAGGQIVLPRTGSIDATSVALASGRAVAVTAPKDPHKDATKLSVRVTQDREFADSGLIDIDGVVRVNKGKLVIDANGFFGAVVNVEGVVTANESDVSIIVGNDANGAGLRVGAAIKRDVLTTAPGEITFTGARAKNRLTINGRTYTLLWDVNDVKAINSTGLNGDYALARDIDFKNAGPFTEMLIGTTRKDGTTNAFSGRLNGLGHDLSKVTINGSGKIGAVGPIGILSGYVGNIGFSDVSVNVLPGKNGKPITSGGVAGTMFGDLQNVFVSGVVNGGFGSIGGLAGELQAGATITSSRVDATVQVSVVSDEHPSAAGGLVGYQDASATIDGSRSKGIVRGAVVGNGGQGYVGDGFAGGLVGSSDGLIRNSSSTATVDGGTRLGGIVGTLGYTGRIEDSAYDGIVRFYPGVGNSYAGGLVGDFYGTIERSSARVSVTGARGSVIGGLVGRQSWGGFDITPSIMGSWFSGVLSGGDASIVGGLAGQVTAGRIETSRANAIVQGGAGSSVGGLVGQLLSPDADIGVRSSVQASYATGTVTAGSQSQAGGLAGLVGSDSSIAGSYSTSDVTSAWGSNAGGIAGRNAGAIASTYATGSVSGGVIGGLVGYQDRTGTLDGSVYVQTDLDAIGGGATTQKRQVKELTLKKLFDGATAKPYLGSVFFTYAKGKRPKLKWEP